MLRLSNIAIQSQLDVAASKTIEQFRQTFDTDISAATRQSGYMMIMSIKYLLLVYEIQNVVRTHVAYPNTNPSGDYQAKRQRSQIQLIDANDMAIDNYDTLVPFGSPRLHSQRVKKLFLTLRGFSPGYNQKHQIITIK